MLLSSRKRSWKPLRRTWAEQNSMRTDQMCRERACALSNGARVCVPGWQHMCRARGAVQVRSRVLWPAPPRWHGHRDAGRGAQATAACTARCTRQRGHYASAGRLAADHGLVAVDEQIPVADVVPQALIDAVRLGARDLGPWRGAGPRPAGRPHAPHAVSQGATPMAGRTL